jgi:hypothetical protein
VHWVNELFANLAKYRGGCIMCMDYSKFSNTRYFRLLLHYPHILTVLRVKLVQLQLEKFLPSKGYIFGFSFGGQLAVHGSIRGFGFNRLAELDGIDNKEKFRVNVLLIMFIHPN